MFISSVDFFISSLIYVGNDFFKCDIADIQPIWFYHVHFTKTGEIEKWVNTRYFQGKLENVSTADLVLSSHD